MASPPTSPTSSTSPSSRTVALDERLPLTCTRQGTCCHGKLVWVNPWELSRLAQALASSVTAVIATHGCDGGIRLRFDGPPGWRDLPGCTFYGEQGCRVHASRPLACRLYPLGRERQGAQVRYLFEGPDFPCLAGCPTVTTLPMLRVDAYLRGQDVGAAEQVADAYLEVVQDLAEGAFVLVVDSGLAASGYQGLLARWTGISGLSGEDRARSMPPELLAMLLDPQLGPVPDESFVAAHAARLQGLAQEHFGALTTRSALADASCAMFAAALHLGASLGADLESLARRWLDTARTHGLR